MGLRVLLDYRPDVQVLWKLKPTLGTGDEFSGIIGKEVEQGQVKLVEWLDADPLAILRTGNVIYFVHHGGSNCYHEAVRYGECFL